MCASHQTTQTDGSWPVNGTKDRNISDPAPSNNASVANAGSSQSRAANLDGMLPNQLATLRLNDLRDLSFAVPSVRYPDDLPAELVETGRVRLPDDGDTGLNDWLLGQSFFPEAFPTEAARDARLGPAHEHIVFEPTTWDQAEAGGFSLADLAIGPGLGEPGFAEIAELVIPAKVEQLQLFGFGGGWSSVSVIVDRVDYTVRQDEEGALSIMASPLYGAWSDEPKIDATMTWLHQAFAARLSTPPTPPILPRRPRTAARELGDAA